AGLLPTGLTHQRDGVGSRRQVGEEVMPQGVGLAKRLVPVKLAVVVQVQIDGPVRQAWLDRDGLHLPDDRAGDGRPDVFQGEVGLLARLQAVARAVLKVHLAGSERGEVAVVHARTFVTGHSIRPNAIKVEAENIDVAGKL